MAVRKGTDIDYSFGKQYYGSNVFYSLQLNFVDALDLKKRTAYISCENKCDLEHMLQFLLTLAAPQAESDKPPASSGPAS